jgi:hypothetical protein
MRMWSEVQWFIQDRRKWTGRRAPSNLFNPPINTASLFKLRDTSYDTSFKSLLRTRPRIDESDIHLCAHCPACLMGNISLVVSTFQQSSIQKTKKWTEKRKHWPPRATGFMWSGKLNNPGSTGIWGQRWSRLTLPPENCVHLSEGINTGRCIVFLDCTCIWSNLIYEQRKPLSPLISQNMWENKIPKQIKTCP